MDTYDVKRDVDEALTGLRIALRASSEHLIERSAWKLVAALEKAEKFAAVTEPERTPETVLRAMLRAYEAALFAAHVAYMRGDKTFDGARRVDRLAADTDAVRGAAAWVAAGNAEVGLSEYRLADYTARLAGTRPLNASPLEV